MWGQHDGTPEQDAPELCDFCGTVVADETELYADFSTERVDVPEIDLNKAIADIAAIAFRHSEIATNRGMEVGFQGVVPEFFKTSESHRFSVSFTALFASCE